MTMKCLAQPATIFSWVRQPLPEKSKAMTHVHRNEPHYCFQICQMSGLKNRSSYPPPLMSVRPASTSSAPSMATSSWDTNTQTFWETFFNSYNCLSEIIRERVCWWLTVHQLTSGCLSRSESERPCFRISWRACGVEKDNGMRKCMTLSNFTDMV